MKTLKFFVLLFVAVAMSCNFVACGGGDKENGEIVQPGGNGGSDEGNDDPNGNENDPRMTRMIPMTEQSTRSSLSGPGRLHCLNIMKSMEMETFK